MAVAGLIERDLFTGGKVVRDTRFIEQGQDRRGQTLWAMIEPGIPESCTQLPVYCVEEVFLKQVHLNTRLTVKGSHVNRLATGGRVG